MHDEMHGMCANVWKCDHLSVALATGWHSHDRDIHLLDSAVLNYCYYCKLLLFFSAKFHCMERVVEYWRESPSRFFFFAPRYGFNLSRRLLASFSRYSTILSSEALPNSRVTQGWVTAFWSDFFIVSSTVIHAGTEVRTVQWMFTLEWL